MTLKDNLGIAQTVVSATKIAKPTGDALVVVREYIDYLRVVQEETTKREMIAAKRDVLVHELNTQKEMMLQYFEHRFTERKSSLEQFFGLLSNASAAKDQHGMDVALSGILGILQDNPLKDFESFKNNMNRPDFLLEL